MFRFPLQRVLEHRERQERDAAAALAAAQDAADAARHAEQVAARARADLAASAHAGCAAPVGALRTTTFLLDQLDQQLARAGAAVDAAAAVVDNREQALRTAYRARRALDRLRERHHHAWQQGAASADRQHMDEIALTRFAQARVRQNRTGTRSAVAPGE